MTYQYATLSSNLSAEDAEEFVHETDTLKIEYSFNGTNCPVNISIQNKLTVPIYVDWKRSAVILDGQTFSYWNDKAILTGTSHGYAIEWTPFASSTFSEIDGEITRKESTSFIPPHSTKQTTMITLQNNFIDPPSDRKAQKAKVYSTVGPYTGSIYYFKKENSPLGFRSFLTVSTEPSFNKPLTYDHDFWVNEIVETSVSPGNYMDNGENTANNRFHTTKSTGVGTALSVTAILILLAALAL
jgi:hypothetical protein